MKNIGKKITQKEMSIGSWITLGHPSIAEIMARSGFDWLAIDMEHSAITIQECQQLIQIIELSGVVPLVRVGENNHNLIKRAMDAGAHGVIVPMVNSIDDAKRAVSAVKYPPVGTRGVGLARAQGYGMEFEKYKNWVNKESTVIVQIEHIEAIRNLEDILMVEGVDASIIGPYDLSASLDYPEDFQRREFKDAIKRYIKVCRNLKKTAGFHVIPPEANMLQERIREGFTFIGLSLDTVFLGKKIRNELEKIKRNKK